MCRGISDQIRTWRVIFDCYGGKNSSDYLGRIRGPTIFNPYHCDNTTAAGIVNSLIKLQRSRAMNMRHFGYCVSRHNVFYTLDNIKVRKTWATTSQRNTTGRNTNMCAHFIYIWNTHQYFYSGIHDQVLVEGVLE